jgi:hypothetical protein
VPNDPFFSLSLQLLVHDGIEAMLFASSESIEQRRFDRRHERCRSPEIRFFSAVDRNPNVHVP